MHDAVPAKHSVYSRWLIVPVLEWALIPIIGFLFPHLVNRIVSLPPAITAFQIETTTLGGNLFDGLPSDSKVFVSQDLGPHPTSEQHIILMKVILLLLLSVTCRQLWNQTGQSSVCKTCIDNGFKYCPNQDLNSGFCCSSTEQCPAVSICSTFTSTRQVMYQLCPSEAQMCIYPRTLVP